MFATSDMIRQWNKYGKAFIPTFVTKAELDAAVAANGGQSLGPSVSVAGVLWGWDGRRYCPVNKTIAKVIKRYDLTSTISPTATYFKLFNDNTGGGFGEFVIPANTFGPGKLNPLLSIKGFININPNSAAVSGIGFRIYTKGRYNEGGITVAATDLTKSFAGGTPSRFVQFNTTMMWTPGSDAEPNLAGLQSYSYSHGLLGYGTSDDNGTNIDVFDHSSGIDWTVDNALHIYLRVVSSGSSTFVAGSREAVMTFD